MTDDHDLERVLRAGLERRARDVDTDAPVADRARTSARRQRRGRVAAGVAALAVAAVAVTAVVVDRSDHPHEDGGSLVTDGGSDGPTPTQWRTESWHGVQVDVPADWGWGTAPSTLARGGPDFPVLCGGPGAKVTADGRELVRTDVSLPYVGRPIELSDLCTGGDPRAHRKAPYVWLGANLDPGTVQLADGYVQETRVVDGTTVTVGARDADLRQRILDSATGGEVCPARLEERPRVESMLTEGMGDVSSMTVCAYRRGGAGYDLVYAAELGPEAGNAFHDAVYAGTDEELDATDECASSPPADEYVVLTLTGDDPMGDQPVTQDFVVDLGCSGIENAPGHFTTMRVDDVAPWATGGIRVVLGYFIGGLG
ncbi:MAG: hypothetical protein JWN22_3923 [Nocardioides sp.]|jgi:hypothetical protein|nr:hypothetical protein [Nocardioides sp.]